MDAFKSGAGFSGNDLYLLIAGVLCVVAILLTIWVWTSAYRGFAKGNVDKDIFTIVCLKAVMLILVFFWLAL